MIRSWQIIFAKTKAKERKMISGPSSSDSSDPSPFSNAIDCARIPEKKPILLIDHDGYINAFYIDDIDIMLVRLGLDRSLLPLVQDIIQANIVYGFAKQVGLRPGLFAKGDVAIIENLKMHVSYQIDDDAHDAVIAALLDSWNRVTSHALASAFRTPTLTPFLEDEDTKFSVFICYEVFVKKLYTGLLNLWCEDSPENLRFYLNITELMLSTLECRPYRRNDYFNYDLLVREIEQLQPIIEPEFVAQIGARLASVKRARDWVQNGCLKHVGNWAGYEIEALEQEFEKPPGERKYEKEDLASALRNILKRGKRLSKKDYLNQQLHDLYQFNTNPYREHKDRKGLLDFVFDADQRQRLGEHEVRRLVHEAIERTIICYADSHHINISDTVFEYPMQLSFLSLPNEVLLEKVASGEIKLPFELFAIYQLTSCDLLREMIGNIVAKPEEPSQMPFPIMFSHGYSMPARGLLFSRMLERQMAGRDVERGLSPSLHHAIFSSFLYPRLVMGASSAASASPRGIHAGLGLLGVLPLAPSVVEDGTHPRVPLLQSGSNVSSIAQAMDDDGDPDDSAHEERGPSSLSVLAARAAMIEDGQESDDEDDVNTPLDDSEHVSAPPSSPVNHSTSSSSTDAEDGGLRDSLIQRLSAISLSSPEREDEAKQEEAPREYLPGYRIVEAVIRTRGRDVLESCPDQVKLLETLDDMMHLQRVRDEEASASSPSAAERQRGGGCLVM